MTFFKHNSDLLPNGFRAVSRGKRFCGFFKMRFLQSVFLLATLFLIYFATFGVNIFSHGDLDGSVLLLGEVKLQSPKVVKPPPKPRKQFSPCKIGFLDSVGDLVEPKDSMNFTQFSLDYIDKEDKPFGSNNFEPRFGGHPSLQDREKSFYATNKTPHCGFVKGPLGLSSTLFNLDEKDKEYMNTCVVVVSSCIFGSPDYLRRPGRRMISEYSKKNVCFVVFVDEQTLSTLSSDGNIPDD